MNNNATIEKMKQMRLSGMAEAYYSNIQSANYQDYTIDQYIAMLVDQEWENRQERKINGLVSKAKFKHQPSIRDVDYSHPRSLDRNLFERLVSLDFIKKNENIIITGPTGCGKSYLAQALGNQACLMGYRVLYSNTSRLFTKLKLSKVDGTYINELKKLVKVDLLILDDFGLQAFDNHAREALMDIIDDRFNQMSTIVSSQIPVSVWYDIIGEGTIADAILDRLVNSSHRIDLKGESLRKGILKNE